MTADVCVHVLVSEGEGECAGGGSSEPSGKTRATPCSAAGLCWFRLFTVHARDCDAMFRVVGLAVSALSWRFTARWAGFPTCACAGGRCYIGAQASPSLLVPAQRLRVPRCGGVRSWCPVRWPFAYAAPVVSFVRPEPRRLKLRESL